MRRRRAGAISPGTPVRYHGSMAEEHGFYTVGPPCPCDLCWALDIDFGDHADVRHVLLRDGVPVLEHVDEPSLTTLTGF